MANSETCAKCLKTHQSCFFSASKVARRDSGLDTSVTWCTTAWKIMPEHPGSA